MAVTAVSKTNQSTIHIALYRFFLAMHKYKKQCRVSPVCSTCTCTLQNMNDNKLITCMDSTRKTVKFL